MSKFIQYRNIARSAENIALYKGCIIVAEQEYRNRRTSIHDVAKTKERNLLPIKVLPYYALLLTTIVDPQNNLPHPHPDHTKEKRTFKNNDTGTGRKQEAK